MNIKVSIIVPIYNVEKYLHRCLNSVINQTYQNIEVLMVNDGSTDNSKNICEEFLKIDKRFKLINKVNQGLSSARNAGLKECTGSYVCFIDSDDFIKTDFIERLVSVILKDKSDIAVCNYTLYYNELKDKKNKAKKTEVITNLEAIKDFLTNGNKVNVMTWNKLYNINLFLDNNIEFPIGKLNEDNFTTYKLLYYSNRVSIISDYLYFYVQRQSSIMNTSFRVNNLDILEALDETKHFLKEKGVYFVEEINHYSFEVYFRLLNKLIDSNNVQSKYMDIMVEYLKKNRLDIYKSHYLTRNEKISLKIFYLNKYVYYLFRKIYCLVFMKGV